MRDGSRLALVLSLIALAAFATVTIRHSGRDTITGVVRDANGPVAGAVVRCKGSAPAVRTDARGRFQLAAGAGATVTAAKEGYFISGLEADRRPLSLLLRPLPAEDCESYRWVDPAPDAASSFNCGNCHGEIYREWSGSGHARSARSRHFLNLFDGSDWHGRPNVGWNLLADHPDGAGVCTACHAPTVAFNDPAYYDLRRARGVDVRGVHCDYCHKIREAVTDNVGLTHGRFGLSLLRPAKGQITFGPLDDVDRGEDSYAPLYRESRYCASCHEGTVFGVPVYTTYTEWLDSPARREGKQCQACHMAPTGRTTNLAPGHGGIVRDPATLASHRFGGDRLASLRRCLQVTLETRREPEAVHARVTVRADDVGHHLPTGFVDRNLVLVVEPVGRDGERLGRSAGPALPAAAGREFAGLPGRVYAKQLRGADGDGPVPFWQTPSVAADTRLVPGRADVAEFVFPPGTTRIRIRLLDRRFWADVARRKGWPDNELTVVDETLHVEERGVRRVSPGGGGEAASGGGFRRMSREFHHFPARP